MWGWLMVCSVCVCPCQGGWTALMWAAYKGRTDVAELLLEKGANPNITGQVWRQASQAPVLPLYHYNWTESTPRKQLLNIDLCQWKVFILCNVITLGYKIEVFLFSWVESVNSCLLEPQLKGKDWFLSFKLCLCDDILNMLCCTALVLRPQYDRRPDISHQSLPLWLHPLSSAPNSTASTPSSGRQVEATARLSISSCSTEPRSTAQTR